MPETLIILLVILILSFQRNRLTNPQREFDEGEWSSVMSVWPVRTTSSSLMVTPHLGAELKKFGLKVSESVEDESTETDNV